LSPDELNDNLEKMAKAIYDYWFVQFDFPDESGRPYKSSGGKMVFIDKLQQEVPDGWVSGTFQNWVKETKGGDWGKDSTEGNYVQKVYCIRGTDIQGLNGKGEIGAPERYILKANAFKELRPYDFIIEISGGSPVQSTGRIALITAEALSRFSAPVICSNFCKALSLKNKAYIFNFLFEWQRLYNAGVFFGFEGKTSGIKNFLFDSFSSTHPVLFPIKHVVEEFYKLVEPLEMQKQKNLKQNHQLATLRDWLLPMLMNGQVKVS